MHKIVFFNSTLSGGAGKFIVTLANALCAQSCEVYIIIVENRIKYDIPEKVHLHILLPNLKPLQRKSEIITEMTKTMENIGSIDLVFSNSTPSNKLLSMLNLPNVYHIIHSAEKKQYRGIWASLKCFVRRHKYKKLYSGKQLVTVSKDLSAYILNDLKAVPKSIRTIYNPFNFEEIRYLAEEDILEIPKEPYILHVGRFDMVSKRHDILLRAYKQANLSQKLVLLGEGEDRKKIETLIETLGLQSKVILPGFSPNPYVWMKHAELFVLSSDFEGFPRVLNEALIVGTPVVSTNCPTGPREILTGTLQEFLVPVGDIDMLALKMKQALETYPSLNDIDLSWLSDEVIAKQYMDLVEEYALHADNNPKQSEVL